MKKYKISWNNLLNDVGLLVKGANETIKNEAKEQKGRFLPMLLGILAASTLAIRWLIRGSDGVSREGERRKATIQRRWVIRAVQDFQWHLIL